MIIWRRKGWLVPVIFFAIFVITQMGINSSFGDGYYQKNEWPKAIALILSALIVAGFGYLLNHKYREMLVDETGAETKGSSHTLFFIPVEYWAIIVPVFLIWANNHTNNKDREELAYINAPKINDIYLLEITRTRSVIEDGFKYGMIKVVNVQSDGVDISEGGYIFDSKKGVREEIKKNDVNAEDYFSEKTYFMDTQSLVTLKVDGDIFKVRRN